jgi:alkylation response protein AidB-like acyl-CoA dehydrogenase
VSIALTDDQKSLADSVAQFAARHAPVTGTRAAFEELAAGMWPGGWQALVDQGLLAVHLPSAVGGDDAGLVELAVVLEELAAGLFPGPVLPTVLSSLVVARHGSSSLQDRLLLLFASGATGACVTVPGGVTAVAEANGGWTLTGTTEPVLGAVSAQVRVVAATTPDGRDLWFALEPGERESLAIERLDSVDLTRDIGTLTLTGHTVPRDSALDVTTDDIRTLAAILASAEAVGAARWSQRNGLAYAKVREQFGRPIGANQAIKHKAARLFIQVETMAASVWDAAEADREGIEQLTFAANAAAVMCLAGAVEVCLETVTLFGGIGYTWEHDVHLYWRRAMSLAGLLGPKHVWEESLGTQATSVERARTLDLSSEPQGLRSKVAEIISEVQGQPADKQQILLAGVGMVMPNYPPPYGIGADAVSQVVIAQEFEKAGVAQPSIVIGAWALPTIMAHGSDEQRERFVSSTLRGDVVWCQLFSEPGAGSDLASLSTRAEKVEGGWLLNGQKVWTSSAQDADWGICLARTDREVPKHKGISYFLVDMRSPGLEIRPLREANGGFLFNEVFFTDVFVPDDLLVGTPGDGWRLARTTLGNERVAIATGMGGNPDSPAQLAKSLGVEGPAVTRDVGILTAKINAFEALGQRALLRQLSGGQPGPEASVLKVVSAFNVTDVRKTSVSWLSAGSATLNGAQGKAAQQLLSLPPMLIGGGTTEIQLNVISEQVLGLPRG